MSSPTSWWSQAACRGVTQLFYPTTDDARAEPDQTRAMREAQCRLICSRCPVIEPCLAELHERPDTYAVAFMAGLAPAERAATFGRRFHEPRITGEQLGLPSQRVIGKRQAALLRPTAEVDNALGSIKAGDVLDAQVREWQRLNREHAS